MATSPGRAKDGAGAAARWAERKAGQLEAQNTACRLALMLLLQLKPRHRVALLIDTYRKRLRMNRQDAVDNWQQLADALP